MAVASLLLASSAAAFVSSRTKLFVPMQYNQLESTGMDAFSCNHPAQRRNIIMRAATSEKDMEAEINNMRVKEIRDELESYGISTKSFLEKKELAEALLAARKEGKTPIKDTNEASSSSSSSSASSTAEGSSNNSSVNRQERLQKEMEKCKSMKVSDLKKELESYGLSTKSYFEKSEFVRAVAEARVDGVKKSAGGSSGAGQQKEEPRDPSFRDVTVSKFSGDSKMSLGGTVIDVKAR